MKWLRHLYQPCKGLGTGGMMVSGSREHIELSRQAAAEGIVLLKNENQALPLAPGKRVVLLGKAGEEYIKGGGGSGEVSVAYIRTLFQGLKIKQAEGKITLYDGLHDFYASDLAAQTAMGREPGMTKEPALSAEQLKKCAEFSDTAIVAICRFSGEGWDRSCDIAGSESADVKSFWESEDNRREAGKEIFRRGDFYLSDEEQALVQQAKAHFAHVIVTLNVGGIVDTCWFHDDDRIEAAVMIGQGGMEGALAAADVLVGDVNPSGHLVDTYARDLTDYPFTASFHESADYVKYYEDIYVGYRYFETLPGAREKVNYPFGFGLSYTDFEWNALSCAVAEGMVVCNVAVRNIGSRPGKQVLQLYFSAPQGKLGKPALELGAYAKTRLLAPGQQEVLTLTMPVGDMASYDDLGKVCKSAWVLEQGDYHIYIGTDVRQVRQVLSYGLEEDVVAEQLHEHLKPRKLEKRMLSDGSFEPLELGEYEQITRPFTQAQYEDLEGVTPEVRPEKRSKLWGVDKGIQLEDVACGKVTLDEFLDALSLEEQVWLLGGQPNTGVANTFGIGNNRDRGIPNVMTADGPAGVRIQPQLEVYTTAWPTATMLASTWNRALVEEIGTAGAKELKENNLGSWLTPAMNIHRSPLCGRNFEYYSEDPLLSGLCAAADVRGVQKHPGVGTSIKHYFANNQEDNRMFCNAHIKERAIREIYLRNFGVCIQASQPMTIMTSYNLINGVHGANCYDSITCYAREECGFKGYVMTDWFTSNMKVATALAKPDLKYPCASSPQCVYAGNDVQMPGCDSNITDIIDAVKDGSLPIGYLQRCTQRLLETDLKCASFPEAGPYLDGMPLRSFVSQE